MYDLRIPFRVKYLKREIDVYETIYPPVKSQLEQLYKHFIPMMSRVDDLIQDYVRHNQAGAQDLNLSAPYHLQLMLIKGEVLAIEHFYKKLEAQFVLVEAFIPAFPKKLIACKSPFADTEYSSDKLGALSTEWNALKVSINNFSGAIYRLKLTRELLEDEFTKLSKTAK